MRNFVIINGVNSNTINGLGINELPPITKPEMRNIREEIDGRDGDIITELGYSAYDKTITIGLFGTGYDINDIVAFFKGEGTIVFSNEPDKYYNFKILNQIDYESLQKFRTASITFHCQPFKYPLNETPLEIEYDYIEDEGETLTLNNTGNATMELNLKGNTSQASTPTPTSPVNVSVVSGDNEVVVCGKNLYNKAISTLDGYLTNDGTEAQSVNYKTSDYIPIEPNTTYATGVMTNSGSNPSRCYYDENKTFISGEKHFGATTMIGTSPNNAKYMRESIPVVDIDKVQIEKGTSSSTYEPYNGDTYELSLGDIKMRGIGTYEDYFVRNSGKNLFDEEYELGTINYDTGALESSTTIIRTKNYQSITPSTQYTLKVPNEVTGVILYYYNNGSYIGGVQPTIGSTTHTTTFTTNASANQVKWRFNSNYTTLNNQTMLNEGSTPTTYEPYGTGQWCKYNAIREVVLDGETDGLKFTTAEVNRNKRYSLILNDVLSQRYTLNTNTKSNYFKYNTNVYSDSGDEIGFIIDNQKLYIRFGSTSELDTITKANAWLSTHNTQVDYPLATPYLSLIEDNNLIEQLDNLSNAMSYEGTTNIWQVNNDKAFIISAKALEDGTNEVVVNNIGNVYSKPLLALEGSGNVDIYLDDTQILKANVESKMNIDINTLEAYNPDTSALLNRQVIGNYNSMTFQPGNNKLTINGSLSKATITNYIRWL